jgi:hypothetical protein
MRTFIQKVNPTQQTMSAKTTIPSRAHFGQSREVNAILHLQRTIGNQAVQRLLEGNTGNGKEDLTTTGITRFGHDFSQILAHPSAPVGIQPKLTMSTPGDIYEQEADRVADMVVQVPDHRTPQVARDESNTEPLPSILGGQEKSDGRKGSEYENEPLKKIAVAEKCGDNERIDNKAEAQRSEDSSAASRWLIPEIGDRIKAMRGDGRPLTSPEREFMEPRFGADFSAVRIHMNQEADSHNCALQARAFTLGSDIFFRAGSTSRGKPRVIAFWRMS